MKYFIPFLLLVMIFGSCRTVKKNSHSTFLREDSTIVIKKASENVKTDYTIKVQDATEQKSGKVKIVLEYNDKESETKRTDTVYGKVTGDPVTDKIIADLTNKRPTRATIDIDYSILNNFKNITHNNIKDSGNINEEQKREGSKVQAEQNSNTERKGIPWYTSSLLWLVLIIVILIIIYKKTNIMTNIKNFVARWLFLLIAVVAFSCNSKPSEKIYKTSTEWTGNWEMGKKVNIDYVFLEITWGQAFHFAAKDGHIVEIMAGVIFILLAAFIFIQLCRNVWEWGLKLNSLMVVLFISGLLFILVRPGSIKWNNEGNESIRVEKSVYDEYKASDNLSELWEQLYTDKRIKFTSGN